MMIFPDFPRFFIFFIGVARFSFSSVTHFPTQQKNLPKIDRQLKIDIRKAGKFP
jgi:hypothetical protein